MFTFTTVTPLSPLLFSCDISNMTRLPLGHYTIKCTYLFLYCVVGGWKSSKRKWQVRTSKAQRHKVWAYIGKQQRTREKGTWGSDGGWRCVEPRVEAVLDAWQHDLWTPLKWAHCSLAACLLRFRAQTFSWKYGEQDKAPLGHQCQLVYLSRIHFLILEEFASVCVWFPTGKNVLPGHSTDMWLSPQ